MTAHVSTDLHASPEAKGQVGVVRLGFAGVDFDIHAFAGPAYRVPANCLAYALPFGQGPTVAQARCRVRVVPGLADGLTMAEAYPVRFERRSANEALVHNGHVRAHVQRLSAGHYDVDAQTSTDERGLAGLVRFVAALIVEWEGGLNLHAAAVDLDGEAVAFCGPSGAGKTTACNLSKQARCLTADQLTVYPYADGYMAWALPWGDRANEALPSAARALPLRALLRVTRGQATPTVELARETARAVFIVRDAVTVSDATPEAEDHRLFSCLRLCDKVHVGHINTVLGQATDRALQAIPPVLRGVDHDFL